MPVQDIGPRPTPTACRLEYLTHPARCGGRCALTTITLFKFFIRSATKVDCLLQTT